jgi:hypothetical protein
MATVRTILARNALLCGAAAAALCLPSPPACAQEAITTPVLASDPNFRDLAGIGAAEGGTGYADSTSHGGQMRTGVFYRSMSLSGLSNADFATLSSLHPVLDIDLRMPSEIEGSPFPYGRDRVPTGAAYVNINILADNPPTPPFNNAYQSFATSPIEAAAFGTVLLDSAHASGPALWHCSEGKDRTGWTAMLLETIAGVPLGSANSPPAQGTIMFNYLASNTYLGATVAYQEWLANGLADVNNAWGSMDAYLRNGLGLTLADIYVLRAKMVYFPELPGQPGFSGNAAAGAALLNELQNSPLSGRYTAYNYYLQSAIDAGTLGGGQARVGGQIHADTAAYLMREPLWIDEALAPYTAGRELRAGQGHLWAATLADGLTSSGGSGNAGSSERRAGVAAGATVRVDGRASATMAIGYNSGTIESAGADTKAGAGMATIAGRYAIASLEAGPYVTARADAGWSGLQSARPLGNGLGTAQGSTGGAFYSGLAGAGYLMAMAPFTVTAHAEVRVTGVNLNGFNETGSELALAVSSIRETSTSLLAGLDVGLDRLQLNGWTAVPSLNLAYERAAGNPRMESTGALYGYGVNQFSAFDSRDLIKAGLGIAAQGGAIAVDIKGSVIAGDGAKSVGGGGQLSFRYDF